MDDLELAESRRRAYWSRYKDKFDTDGAGLLAIAIELNLIAERLGKEPKTQLESTHRQDAKLRRANLEQELAAALGYAAAAARTLCDQGYFNNDEYDQTPAWHTFADRFDNLAANVRMSGGNLAGLTADGDDNEGETP